MHTGAEPLRIPNIPQKLRKGKDKPEPHQPLDFICETSRTLRKTETHKKNGYAVIENVCYYMVTRL